MILEAFSLSLIAAAALLKFTDPRPLGCLAIQSSSVVLSVPNREPAVGLERCNSRGSQRSPMAFGKAEGSVRTSVLRPNCNHPYTRPRARSREVGHRSPFEA